MASTPFFAQFRHQFRYPRLDVVGYLFAVGLTQEISAHVDYITVEHGECILVDRVKRPEYIDCNIAFHYFNLV